MSIIPSLSMETFVLLRDGTQISCSDYTEHVPAVKNLISKQSGFSNGLLLYELLSKSYDDQHEMISGAQDKMLYRGVDVANPSVRAIVRSGCMINNQCIYDEGAWDEKGNNWSVKWIIPFVSCNSVETLNLVIQHSGTNRRMV